MIRRIAAAAGGLLLAAGITLGGVTTAHATSTNTLEDTFQRASQAGWGGSSNSDGVTQFGWHGDADGTHSYDTIAGDTGQMAYNGAVNTPDFAGTGTQYNGGDELAEVSLSSIGSPVYYLTQNFCADKSCGYEARLDTNNNTIALARRSGGSTSVKASQAFTATAGTKYWIRFNYSAGALKMRFWADGTTEPGTWTLTWTDTSPLASNYNGIGGSWNASTTAKTNTYYYAFSSNPSVPAQAPGGSGGTGCGMTGAPDNNVSEVSSDAYHLQANEFNSSAELDISNTGCTANFGVSNSAINNSLSGAPGAYPSLYKGCHWGYCTASSGLPVTESAMQTAGKVTTSYSTSTTGPGAWDDAYDIWFNSASSTSNNSDANSLEMMIWLTHNGSVQPAGSLVASNVTIGGVAYDIWKGGSSPGGTVTYVVHTPVTSVGSLDLGPLAADANTRGYIPGGSSAYLIDVEAGFELWQGGTGLTASSFSVNVN